jgi:hypothetical protein
MWLEFSIMLAVLSAVLTRKISSIGRVWEGFVRPASLQNIFLIL